LPSLVVEGVEVLSNHLPVAEVVAAVVLTKF
jgi:hypothetical protein